MALTRLSIAVLLVCCFASAIEKPTVWDSMNLKARQKWERIALGEYRGKATGPSARDKYWTSMRKDDSYNNTVPTHKYVEAQNFFISQQSNAKRFYNSPWTNIGPNKNNLVGGRTRAILVQSTGILYAGCVSGGLWKSTNGGTSWKVLTDLMANIAVTAIAEDSTGSIYVGTGEGFNSADAKRGYGIFKASNDVFTQLSSTANPDFYYVNKIVVGQKDTIYAATGSGLFVSLDSGNSFSALLKGNMMDVAIAKLNGNDVILCWRAAYGLYVSVDGSNFKQSIGTSNQDDNMHRGSIAVSPSNPSVVYISLSANTGRMVNVYKSADSGQTFTGQLVLGASTSGRLNQVLLSNPYYSYDTGSGTACVDGVSAGGYNQGWYDNAIAVDPLSADIVYIGGVDLWKSNDGGRTFNMISTWWSGKNNYLHADQHTIVFSPKYATDKTVYIGNDGGVYKSTNIGAGRYANPCSPPTSGLPTYTPLNSNYGTIQFYHGSVHPTSALYVAGCQDNGSWKYSNSQWEIVAGGDGGFTAIDPDVPSRYYTSYTFASITRRESTGDSRVLTNGQLDGDGVFINPFVMDPNNGKILYTCGKTCYRCSDATAATIAWQPLGSALPQGVSALAVSRDSSKLYIGGQDGAFYRASLPNGAPTQVGQSTLCPNCGKFYISAITVHPKIADRIFVTISSFGDPHLWQSNDSGNTWTSISYGIPDVPVLDLLIIPTSPSTFYLGTDLGLLYSENDGVDWHWINEFGLANVPVYKLQYQVATETIFAFSHGRGVYKAVTTTTGSTMWSDGSASSTIWQATIGDGAPMEATTTTGTAQNSKISMPVLIGIAAGGGAVVIVIVVVSVVLVKRKITRKRSESREHVLAKYVEEVIAPVSMQTVVKQ